MVRLNENSRRALSAGRLGHLVTVNEDGSPQASVVWIGVDGDDVVVGHLMGGQKVQNIRRDARVVLTVEADGANEIGLGHYLIIYANASLDEGGAPELLQRLAEVYLGPGVTFPDFEAPPGHVIRLRVERVGGVGPWTS